MVIGGMKIVPFNIGITYRDRWLLGFAKSLSSGQYDPWKQVYSSFFCIFLYEFTSCSGSNDEDGFLRARKFKSKHVSCLRFSHTLSLIFFRLFSH